MEAAETTSNEKEHFLNRSGSQKPAKKQSRKSRAEKEGWKRQRERTQARKTGGRRVKRGRIADIVL